jgi:hypothetical protein
VTTALLLIGAVWIALLVLWVALKFRQPKYTYPSPTRTSRPERRKAA